ncbi:MAG: hypothetical protein QM692_00235, partial [Thermomicrobiales bacterium]
GLPPWELPEIAAISGDTAEALADAVLHAAIERDAGKPNDDMSVVALILREQNSEPVLIRRMSAEVPIS